MSPALGDPKLVTLYRGEPDWLQCHMRLGLFGGSFDPPHLGHLAVARAAAGASALDEVLFVPTGQQPLKPDGAVAPFADRLAMVEILCRQQPSDRTPVFTASSLEAPRPETLPNYTVDTLIRVREELSARDSIFVLVGADAFLDLRRWKEPERLLSLADWIVISRPGFSLQDLDAMALRNEQRQRVHLLKGVAEPASATAIRRQLGTGSDCEQFLPREVFAYIRQHHLYGT